jgi:tRNA threonylcarbamoyladenosine biosynthesis protein TsaB
MILTIRTDKPEAEIGLFEDDQKLAYETWEGHRRLSTTIHKKIESLLHKQQKDWCDIKGIVCFKGPGSFTGLRIGLTVGNTVAAALSIPIVGTMGENWVEEGLKKLATGEYEEIVLPEYGSDAHITKQKR